MNSLIDTHIKQLRTGLAAVNKARRKLSREEEKLSQLQEDVAQTGYKNINKYVTAKARLDLQPQVIAEAEENLDNAEAALMGLLREASDHVREFAYAKAEQRQREIAKQILKYCRHVGQATELANMTEAVQKLYKAQEIFIGDNPAEIAERALKFLEDPHSFELRREVLHNVDDQIKRPQRDR